MDNNNYTVVSAKRPTAFDLTFQEPPEQLSAGGELPRENVAARRVLGHTFRIRCRTPQIVRFGTDSANMCLVSFDLTFNRHFEAGRYRHAMFEVHLVDLASGAGASASAASTSSSSAHDDAVDKKPRLAVLSPGEYRGPVHEATVNQARALGLNVNRLGVNARIEHTQDRGAIVKSYVNILGDYQVDDQGATVTWDMHENAITRQGLPPRASVSILVHYQRKFVIRPRLWADICVPAYQPLCADLNNPLLFDPDAFLPYTITENNLTSLSQLREEGDSFVKGCVLPRNG